MCFILYTYQPCYEQHQECNVVINEKKKKSGAEYNNQEVCKNKNTTEDIADVDN